MSLADIHEWGELCANLREADCTIEACGSRVTCNPPPLDTDMDFLVQILPVVGKVAGNQVRDVMALLEAAEYVWEGSSEHYQNVVSDGFMSWRKGKINIILTSSIGFAERHRAATALCRRLNLPDKQDRIAVFQAVLYGKIWEKVDG